MSQPICLITGVDDGTGVALVRRFAQSNYLKYKLFITSEQ